MTSIILCDRTIADLWRGELSGNLAQPLLGMALLLLGAALVIWR